MVHILYDPVDGAGQLSSFIQRVQVAEMPARPVAGQGVLDVLADLSLIHISMTRKKTPVRSLKSNTAANRFPFNTGTSSMRINARGRNGGLAPSRGAISCTAAKMRRWKMGSNTGM